MRPAHLLGDTQYLGLTSRPQEVVPPRTAAPAGHETGPPRQQNRLSQVQLVLV